MKNTNSYKYHKSLPLLDWATNVFDMDLEWVLLISCHHILETNLFLMHYLFEKNLRPENVICLWKCYSTSSEIYHLYEDEWININKQSIYFNPKQSFGVQYSNNVEIMLDYIIWNVEFEKYKKVIIRDDGWELLYRINNRSINKWNFIWIEHTSNWYHKLKDKIIDFPIINIARSNIKLVQESPYIVELAKKNFHNFTSRNQIFPKRILIVWGWAIGSSLKEILMWEYMVDIYDIDENKSTISWKYEDILKNYDVIFWATWKNILSYPMFETLRKWTLLVSVSSWDYEFCTLDIRSRTEYEWVWDDVRLDWKCLLNWWFPITFIGESETAPLEDIQLTRAIIYWAIYQTTKDSNYDNWFVEFDKIIEYQIWNKYKQIRFGLKS